MLREEPWKVRLRYAVYGVVAAAALFLVLIAVDARRGARAQIIACGITQIEAVVDLLAPQVLGHRDKFAWVAEKAPTGLITFTVIYEHAALAERFFFDGICFGPLEPLPAADAAIELFFMSHEALFARRERI